MGDQTKIAWTDATVNFWQGCHKVSAGCKFCYMFREKAHYGQDPNVVVRSSPATFNAPLKWAKNREKYGHINRVFVCSWSDFFIEEADPWREEAWAIIRQTPNLTYQICTKRPERIAACLPPDWGAGYPNIWLGVTAENQEMAKDRIPCLLSVPAVIHWLSIEPMLGPIDLDRLEYMDGDPEVNDSGELTVSGYCINALDGSAFDDENGALSTASDGEVPLIGKIDWVVTGGESGPKARPMLSAWADDIRRQCSELEVAYFHKQNGEWVDAGHPEFGKLPEAKLAWIQSDGTPWPENFVEGEDDDVNTCKRVGRERAGHLLYGKEWHQFPALPKGSRKEKTVQEAQEQLGQTIDRLDSLTHAMTLPMAADVHLSLLRSSLPEVVADLKKYFVMVTGENPWET